jgi:type I restriction enzyme S subunit
LTAEWQTMSLQDAGVLLIDCVHATPKAVENGYPYVAIPQMKRGRVDFKDARRISHADFIEWTRKARPQVNDVVLSRRTNPGVTATFGDQIDFALGQNLVLLRADGTKVLPEFLRWLVVGPAWWKQIEKFNNVGAIFDSLRCADIPRFELPIPPKTDQQLIANLLSALDDKIYLNEQMNETLQAVARAIYRDWFVDFGPTRAKQESRTPYLASELWSLFPDRLDDDGKPEGWERIVLREAADVFSGGTPAKDNMEFWNGTIPWISPKVMTEIHVTASDDRVTERAIGRGTRMVPSGAVLVMVRGMGLHQGVRISQARCDVTFNQDVKALVGKRLSGTHLLFGLLDAAQYLFSKVEASGHGTGKLPTETIEGICFVTPTGDPYPRLIGPLDALNDRIAANNAESNTLAALRNLLLPTLISGDIRVKIDEMMFEAPT